MSLGIPKGRSFQKESITGVGLLRIVCISLWDEDK